jgi:CRP/FNR family nitrogen fixation transcriptional regulator
MLLLGRKNAMERVVAFLLDMDRRLTVAGVMALPMCRRDIGDYLGLTLETVSRSLSALAEKGALSFNGSRQIMLNNRARLEAMSE